VGVRTFMVMLKAELSSKDFLGKYTEVFRKSHLVHWIGTHLSQRFPRVSEAVAMQLFDACVVEVYAAMHTPRLNY